VNNANSLNSVRSSLVRSKTFNGTVGEEIKGEELLPPFFPFMKGIDIAVYNYCLFFLNCSFFQRRNEGNTEEENNCFMYRRPTLYPLEIAVDFLKSL
jgi:hypothetical protein